MAGDPALARDRALPTAAMASPVLSVSALNRSVRDLIEHRLPVTWVAGEISNFTAARSGHFYFSLKDSTAQVRCAMWRQRNTQVRFRPKDGMAVLARGL